MLLHNKTAGNSVGEKQGEWVMTKEELKKKIEAILRNDAHNAFAPELGVWSINGKQVITLPFQEYKSGVYYYLASVRPWTEVGYALIEYIWSNKIELVWEARLACSPINHDRVGALEGRDILCSVYRGMDVRSYFSVGREINLDEVIELLERHIPPPEEKV